MGSVVFAGVRGRVGNGEWGRWVKKPSHFERWRLLFSSSSTVRIPPVLILLGRELEVLRVFFSLGEIAVMRTFHLILDGIGGVECNGKPEMPSSYRTQASLEQTLNQ